MERYLVSNLGEIEIYNPFCSISEMSLARKAVKALSWKRFDTFSFCFLL